MSEFIVGIIKIGACILYYYRSYNLNIITALIIYIILLLKYIWSQGFHSYIFNNIHICNRYTIRIRLKLLNFSKNYFQRLVDVITHFCKTLLCNVRYKYTLVYYFLCVCMYRSFESTSKKFGVWMGKRWHKNQLCCS